MTTSGTRRGSALRETETVLRQLLAVAAAMLAAVLFCIACSPAQAAAQGGKSRRAPSAVVASMRSADHNFAVSADLLRRCRRSHPGHCSAELSTFRSAHRRLTYARAKYTRFKTRWEINDKTAPTLNVVSQTLSWNEIGTVSSYVLAKMAPGAGEVETTVSGTSATPTLAPGETVQYKVRTNVSGSSWSHEVSITYPAAIAPVQPSPPIITETKTETQKAPVTEKAPVTQETTEKTSTEKTTTTETSTETTLSGSLQTGIVSGSETLDYEGATKLGAKLVRLGWEVGEPAKNLEKAVAEYAARGIRVLPLACFDGSMPNATDAQNLASWAKEFGAGGTFWTNHPADHEMPIQDIEFGNETSYSYQYSTDTPAGYTNRGESYALQFVEAEQAIKQANSNVGLLAQGDAGNAGTSWMSGMFKAVPNFGSYVAGWTIHPYGTGWRGRLEELISEAKSHGAPSTIPIDITEWGLATDNGSCLSENYGWNRCMTYQEAATTLTNTFKEMRTLLGSRFGMFMLYQVRDQKPAGTSTEREAYFGALQRELQPKGAYTTAAEAVMAE